MKTLEARIATLLNWPVDHGEGLQILRYEVGTEYKPHYDYFDPDSSGTSKLLERGGQRVGTLIIYLSEPEKGGGTVFPDVNLEVTPKRGNAVFFSYPQPHPSSKSLHGGKAVISGEKWIAVKWLRDTVFDRETPTQKSETGVQNTGRVQNTRESNDETRVQSTELFTAKTERVNDEIFSTAKTGAVNVKTLPWIGTLF